MKIWKKLGSFVTVTALALSLTGCGGEEESINASVSERLYQTSVATIESLVSYDNASMELALEENPDMDEFVKSAFLSWMDSSEELGAYEGLKESSAEEAVKFDSNQYIVTLDADFANRDAVIEMIYDAKLTAESIGFSPNYSMGDKMRDAGMNTVVGLVTVFLMLVFLSLIISLMKFIPQMVDKFTKKAPAEPVPAPAAPTPAPALVAEEEELADDSVLVAVIAAAIAAAENTSADGFVVRSIRKSKNRNW